MSAHGGVANKRSSNFGNMSNNLLKNRVSHVGNPQSTNLKPENPSDKNEMANELGNSFRRVSLAGDDDGGYIPISCLNTFTHDWALKVRVTRKYPMRQWNNARSQGELFSCDLIDRSDCQIQATFFNEGARKYFEDIHEGKIYRMSGGQIKMANKRFTTIKNDFQITFDSNAEIEQLNDNKDSLIKSGQIYNFTAIKDLQGIQQTNTMVEVIGVITEDQGRTQIQIKATGDFRDKRTIQIADESGSSVSTTLWGQSASIEDIGIGQIIAIKGAKTSSYGGISLNVDDGSSQIEVNPAKVEKCHALQKWYANIKGSGSLPAESLTLKGDGLVNLNQLPYSSIAEMNDTLMADQANSQNG